MSRDKELVKNTGILAIGTFFPKLVVLITLPILTGYLSETDYGTYDLVVTLVSLLLPAVTLQIQAASFRFLIEVRNDEKQIKIIVSTIFSFTIVTSLFVLIIAAFCLPVDSALDKTVICAYFLVDILLNTSRQIVRGLSQNLDYTFSAIINSIGNVVFVFLLVAFLNLGFVGAVGTLTLSSLLAFVFLVIKSRIWKYFGFSTVSKATLKELLFYSWPMVPNSLSLWVMRLSDRLMVTAFLGIEQNAIYAVANKIPQVLTTAQSTFTMAWQENASIASNDENVGEYYSSMFATMYRFYVGCCAFLIGVTPILFKFLVNEKYDIAYYQMPILFLGVFFNCLTAYFGGIYVAFKKTKSVGITTTIAAIINLLIDFVLVKQIGIYAASISTLVSYLFLFIYRSFDVKRFVDLKIDWKTVCFWLIILVAESAMSYMRQPILQVINIVIGTCLLIGLNKSIIILLFSKLRRKI